MKLGITLFCITAFTIAWFLSDKRTQARGMILGHVQKELKLSDNSYIEVLSLTKKTIDGADFWSARVRVDVDNKTLYMAKVVVPRLTANSHTGQELCLNLRIDDYGGLLDSVKGFVGPITTCEQGE